MGGVSNKTTSLSTWVLDLTWTFFYTFQKRNQALGAKMQVKEYKKTKNKTDYEKGSRPHRNDFCHPTKNRRNSGINKTVGTKRKKRNRAFGKDGFAITDSGSHH
jgi:hypothetical protein